MIMDKDITDQGRGNNRGYGRGHYGYRRGDIEEEDVDIEQILDILMIIILIII